LIAFLRSACPETLEVGCGTGHCLGVATPYAARLAGLDPSTPMLERARNSAHGAHLIHACAEL
jgi:predicted TPR repeat methyltransferase